jgi:hypothetical protein
MGRHGAFGPGMFSEKPCLAAGLPCPAAGLLNREAMPAAGFGQNKKDFEQGKKKY